MPTIYLMHNIQHRQSNNLGGNIKMSWEDGSEKQYLAGQLLLCGKIYMHIKNNLHMHASTH